MKPLENIDHSAIKISQALGIGLNILAFILGQSWLALFVALVMLLGALINKPGFGLIYRYVLKPLGWVKPDIRQDHHEPHRFAQALGGTFMLLGSAMLFLGASLPGWILVWMVTALAALNLFAGFCVGCMIYYWLSRWNLPGFNQLPPPGVIPGLRPSRQLQHDS
jgi:hypothetical protein